VGVCVGGRVGVCVCVRVQERVYALFLPTYLFFPLAIHRDALKVWGQECILQDLVLVKNLK
jgi:hypothetical protein